MILPRHGPGVGSVTMGQGRYGEEDETAASDPRGQALGDPQLRRVDEIVGGIDPHHGGGDLREAGLGVIVPGGVHLIDEVVGVQGLAGPGGGTGQIGRNSLGGWQRPLHLLGRAAGDGQKIFRRARRDRP